MVEEDFGRNDAARGRVPAMPHGFGQGPAVINPLYLYGDSCPANWGRPRFWAQQWKAAAPTGERGQEKEDEELCSMRTNTLITV